MNNQTLLILVLNCLLFAASARNALADVLQEGGVSYRSEVVKYADFDPGLLNDVRQSFGAAAEDSVGGTGWTPPLEKFESTRSILEVSLHPGAEVVRSVAESMEPLTFFRHEAIEGRLRDVGPTRLQLSLQHASADSLFRPGAEVLLASALFRPLLWGQTAEEVLSNVGKSLPLSRNSIRLVFATYSRDLKLLFIETEISHDQRVVFREFMISGVDTDTFDPVRLLRLHATRGGMSATFWGFDKFSRSQQFLSDKIVLLPAGQAKELVFFSAGPMRTSRTGRW